jgi:subtilase family serine protease
MTGCSTSIIQRNQYSVRGRSMRDSLVALSLVAVLLFLNSITPPFTALTYAHTRSFSSARYKQIRVCEHAAKRFARCLAIELQSDGIVPHMPQGLTPEDLREAYNLKIPSGGEGQTIAVVGAYHNPSAAFDLAVYSAEFALPPCTIANGCLKQVDQDGGTYYPQADRSWACETSLDLEMVHAIAPRSHILLIEAASASFSDLGTAVNTAARLGANVVNNSYGSQEDRLSAKAFAHDYNHPHMVIVASSGDSGYGVSLPAAFNTVIAVGGTSLRRANNSRGWSESAWGGSGSGCSKYINKPTWQHDAGCNKRTVADVSAIADPQTGVAVYTTYGGHGWGIFGGTSVAAPIIAGVYALASNAALINGAYLYNHADSLNDIVGGSNGHCNNTYLCTAVLGYDAITGLGSPNRTGAF